MWHSIYQDDEDGEFNFSFSVDYIEKVRFIVYGHKTIINAAENDGLNIYTIQLRSVESVFCLICHINFVDLSKAKEHSVTVTHQDNVKNDEVSAISLRKT